MASSCCCYLCRQKFLFFSLGLVLVLLLSPAASDSEANTTFRPREELLKHWRVKSLLRGLNKPSVKSIQSPDGDLIDCVPFHLQPAFDHPRLKGHKIPDPPERPRSKKPEEGAATSFQLWAASGEACLEGTIPIRRTMEGDILRASSVKRFGRKRAARVVRRGSSSSGHEHAVGYVAADQYYGAKASINVWTPRVATTSEFSLSQIWVIAGSFSNDLNTIEAGWQVPRISPYFDSIQ